MNSTQNGGVFIFRLLDSHCFMKSHSGEYKFLAVFYFPFTVNLQERSAGRVKFTPVNLPIAYHTEDVIVIFVTRPNGSKFYLNPELIQTVEATPDTVITLVSNKKMIVKDKPEEIAARFIEYRRRTMASFVSENTDT